MRRIIISTLISSMIILLPSGMAWKRGKDTTRLTKFAKTHGMTVKKIDDNCIELTGKNNRIKFTADSRKITFNGNLIWMNRGAVKKGRNWYISRIDDKKTLTPLFKGGNEKKKKRVILIDPGHGGSDTGARIKGSITEKERTMLIASRLKARLQKRENTEIIMTRSDDRSASLKSRSDAAKKHNPDLMISIHLNSAANSKAEGVETYLITPKGEASSSGGTPDKKGYAGNIHDEKSMRLAYMIHSNLLRKTAQKDRGIKRSRFSVIKNSPCPTVLVECGFISNKNDRTFLKKETSIDLIVSGLYEGIVSYLKKECEK